MEIKIKDLYVFSYGSGYYENHFSFEKVIIGNAVAKAQFNKITSGYPCDYCEQGALLSSGYPCDYAHAALYKAKVCDNVIEADHDNVICEKKYDVENGTWVNCVDED